MGPSGDSNQPAIKTLRVDEAFFIEADCRTQPVVNISFVDDRYSYVVEIHTEIARESAGDEYESNSEDESFYLSPSDEELPVHKACVTRSGRSIRAFRSLHL